MISIDPGLTGAMVMCVSQHSLPIGFCFSRSSSVKGITLDPVRNQLKNYKSLSDDRDCYIELLHPRPGQNCKSTWTQAYVLAQTESLLELEGFKLHRILPANWMRWAKLECGEDPAKIDGKKAARILCETRHPDLYNRWRGPRSKKLHDGIADALGLLLYAQSLANRPSANTKN